MLCRRFVLSIKKIEANKPVLKVIFLVLGYNDSETPSSEFCNQCATVLNLYLTVRRRNFGISGLVARGCSRLSPECEKLLRNIFTST